MSPASKSGHVGMGSPYCSTEAGQAAASDKCVTAGFDSLVCTCVVHKRCHHLIVTACTCQNNINKVDSKVRQQFAECLHILMCAHSLSPLSRPSSFSLPFCLCVSLFLSFPLSLFAAPPTSLLYSLEPTMVSELKCLSFLYYGIVFLYLLSLTCP